GTENANLTVAQGRAFLLRFTLGGPVAFTTNRPRRITGHILPTGARCPVDNGQRREVELFQQSLQFASDGGQGGKRLARTDDELLVPRAVDLPLRVQREQRLRLFEGSPLQAGR